MNSNKNVVPEARDGMNRFKMEAANEVGVNLKQGYNGDLTSRQAGSIGGRMVNITTSTRTIQFVRHNRIAPGHRATVQYAFAFAV